MTDCDDTAEVKDWRKLAIHCAAAFGMSEKGGVLYLEMPRMIALMRAENERLHECRNRRLALEAEVEQLRADKEQLRADRAQLSRLLLVLND